MPSACERGGCGGPSSNPGCSLLPELRHRARQRVEIEPEAIAEETQHHPASGEAAWQQAARALLSGSCCFRKHGAAPSPQIPKQMKAAAAKLRNSGHSSLAGKLVESPAASEEECRRYYDANSHHFRTPDLFEPSHILIEPEGTTRRWQRRKRKRAIALGRQQSRGLCRRGTEFRDVHRAPEWFLADPSRRTGAVGTGSH